MRKSLLSFSLFLLASFIWAGCSSKAPEKPRIQEIPAWFNDAGNAPDGYLYGIASNPSLARAKEKALREIAAKIQVSVQSETEAVTNKIGTAISSSYRESIRSKVEDIRFQNPEVLNQAVIDNIYYVRLRVSVDSVIKLTTQELTQIDRKLLPISRIDSSNASNLKKLFDYKSFDSDLDNAISLCLRLQSLQNLQRTPIGYPYKKMLDNRTAHKAKVSEYLKSVSLNVKVPDDFKDSGSEIINALNAEGIKAGFSAAKSDGVLEIAPTFTKSKIYNDFLVQADVQLTLKDQTGKTLSTNGFQIKAFSPTNHQEAKRALRFQIRKMIAKQGILQLLNIQTNA